MILAQNEILSMLLELYMFPLEDKTEYINALARYELLILDDLGTERSSEYALGIVFSVIDRRYRSGRPLIVTTYLPIKQLKADLLLPN